MHQHIIQFGAAANNKRTVLPTAPFTHLVPDWLKVFTYAQDANSTSHNFPGGGKDECGAVNTDGHGGGGEDWSVHYNIAVHCLMVERWWDIKRMLRKKGDSDRVAKATAYTKQLMKDAEEVVAGRLGDRVGSGGTTCTASFVMIVKRERFIIQAAVGDGPGGIWKDGQATQTLDEANGDNIAAVQAHVDRRFAEGVYPEMVVYSRLNIHGAICGRPIEYPPGSGRFEPIPAYIYVPIVGEQGITGYKVTPNELGYEAIRPYYPYGTQSRNRPEVHLRERDNVWAVKEEDMAANYGNTVLAGSNGQNLTGAGDFTSPFCTCDASVSIRVENGPCTVYGMSDGVGDLFSQTVICKEIVRQHDTCGVTLESFRDWVEGEIKGEDFYTCMMGHPVWDDISFTAIVLPAW